MMFERFVRSRRIVLITLTLILSVNHTIVEAKTTVIYLMGLAGSGKFTIAKQLSKRGYKVVDNHLINNPIFSLLDKDQGPLHPPEGTTDKINQIRNVVLEFIKEDKRSNYVLTNQLLENDYHRHIYQNILHMSEYRNAWFIPVVITVSREERAKRIASADRKHYYKITDPNEARWIKHPLRVSHPNLLTVDVTHLSADQAALKILQHVNAVQHRR